MTEKCKKIIDLYQAFLFLSRGIEKVISIRILGHILDNNIVDSFQSAYRAGHSCETALLRLYNDIVTTVGKGNGSILVLLDLSVAFDLTRLTMIIYSTYSKNMSELAVVHNGQFGHILLIVHKEFKLMVFCLILLVCCVGCHRAQFWDQ